MSLIDAPGKYRTRDGRLVEIHDIRGGSSWEAKGTLYTPRPCRRDKRSYNIWKITGQFMAVGQDNRDIISKEAA